MSAPVEREKSVDEIVECGPLGTVTVPGDWIDLVTYYSDLFRTDHCGYWAERIRIDGVSFIYEHDDVRATGAQVKAALKTHRAGLPLLARWTLLDRAFAVKAYLEGVKRYGAGFYEDGDAETYDVAIQMAALGEVRYG